MKRWSLLLTILMLALTSGCTNRKPTAVAVPTAARSPVDLGAAGTEPARSEPAMPEEPAIGAERVVVPPLRPGELVRQQPEVRAEAEPTESAAPAKRPRPSAPGTVARPSEAETPVETERGRTDQRPPSLKPMMSEAERRQLESLTQGHLERARRNLAALQESRLAENERSVLQEARSFVARAEQLRQADPAMANSLAERAAILTQELLRKQR